MFEDRRQSCARGREFADSGANQDAYRVSAGSHFPGNRRSGRHPALLIAITFRFKWNRG
jgi:hypothetical protein